MLIFFFFFFTKFKTIFDFSEDFLKKNSSKKICDEIFRICEKYEQEKIFHSPQQIKRRTKISYTQKLLKKSTSMLTEQQKEESDTETKDPFHLRRENSQKSPHLMPSIPEIRRETMPGEKTLPFMFLKK